MSAAFTPGPWKADRICVREAETERTVCIISPNVSVPARDSSAESRANARLIAAAPELYAAADRALNYIANTEGEFGIELDSGIALRAALAKARGDQP